MTIQSPRLISSRGQKAWDDMLNTINICKFNIGSGATGIVTHSFYGP